MAAGILTASLRNTSGPKDEERSQLEKPPENNSNTHTNTNAEFDVVDERGFLLLPFFIFVIIISVRMIARTSAVTRIRVTRRSKV